MLGSTSIELTIQDKGKSRVVVFSGDLGPYDQPIVRSFEQLMRVAVPNAWQTRETSTQRDMVLAIHRDLAQAIADRDPAAATRLMDAHFDRSISDVFHRISQSG